MTTRESWHAGMVGPNERLQEGSISDIDGGASEADSSSLIDEEQDYLSAKESLILEIYVMVAAWVFVLKRAQIAGNIRRIQVSRLFTDGVPDLLA